MAEFVTPKGFQDNWRPPAGSRVLQPQRPAPSGTGRADKSRLARIARRAPEAMVKITGRKRDGAHVQSHLEYISRNGKLELEENTGERVGGRSGVRELGDRWDDANQADLERRRTGSAAISMILSMPAGTDPDRLREAARAFAHHTFSESYDYVMALHTDVKHPHVHLTVRTVGHDGRRLNPRKADLDAWRQSFARELRARGIEAEATPRRARGKVQKAQRGPIRQMRDRGVTPQTVRSAYLEVAQELTGRKNIPTRPWEENIVKRQQTIRQTYLATAGALALSPDAEDRRLAEDVQKFVAGMPPVETRRHAIAREIGPELRKEFGRGPDRSSDRDPGRSR